MNYLVVQLGPRGAWPFSWVTADGGEKMEKHELEMDKEDYEPS